MNAILRTFRHFTLVAYIILISLFSSQAQSFSVTTTGDTPDSNPGDGLCDDGTGSCSLRAAIMEANSLGGTAATIAIPAGVYELSIIGINENTGLTGDLDITSNITITGAGAQSTIINADSIDRVFHVLTGNILTLSQLQITEGLADRNNGGGILNEGVLNLDYCEISNCIANLLDETSFLGGGFGGGIANHGTATVINSTLKNNKAIGCEGPRALTGGGGGGSTPGFGGGIYNHSSASIELTNCTISGNYAMGGMASRGSTNGGSFSSAGSTGGGPNPGTNGAANAGAGGNATGDYSGGGGGGSSCSNGGNGGSGGYGAGGGGTGARSCGGSSGGIGTGGFGGGDGDQSCCSSSGGGGAGAGFGGGIFNNGGAVTLVNVTVAYNQALGGFGRTSQGGYAARGLQGMGIGGGIFNRTGTVDINNTLIANNNATVATSGYIALDTIYEDLFGTFTSVNGHNLIFATGTSTTLGGTTTGNIVGQDPLLLTLAMNGGTTFTHAIEKCPNSPAIDAAFDGIAPALDQRDFPRFDVYGLTNIVDIGAYESGDTLLTFSGSVVEPCIGSANGSANVNVIAGTAPFTYSWDLAAGSQTTATANALSVGTFTVSVQDVFGCARDTTFTLVGVSPESAGNDSALITCNGIGTLLDLNSLLSTGVIGGNWEETTAIPSGQFTTTSGLLDVSGLGAGNFIFEYIITGTSPCPNDTSTHTITVEPSPVASILNDTSVCNGALLDLIIQISGGIGPFDLTYSDGSGSTSVFGISSGYVIPINATMTQTYTVLSILDQGSGCSGSIGTDATITVTPGASPVITGPVNYCAGSISLLDAGIGFTIYNWSTGATTQTASVTIADNPITVSVEDPNGCIGTSAPFNVSEDPLLQTFQNDTICDGETLLIHGILETTNGTYDATYTAASGCDSISSITLVVNPLPTVTTGSNVDVCDGQNTTLFGSGANSYSWDFGVTDGVAFIPTNTQIYTVTGTDLNGCMNTAQITVSVNAWDDATFSYDDTLYCIGGSDPVVSLSGTTGGSFSATSGIDLDPVSGTIVLNTSITGSYTITYTTNGICPVSNDTLLTITNSPNADFAYNSTYCPNDPNPTPITIGPGILGSFSGSSGALFLNTLTGEVDLSLSTPGIYTVTNSVAIGGCPISTFDATVEIHELPTGLFQSDTTICAGAPIPDIGLILTGSGPWTVDYTIDGVPNSATLSSSPGFIDGGTVGTYDFNTISDQNCTSSGLTNLVTVAVQNLPIIDPITAIELCEGSVLNITPFSSNEIGTTYDWVNMGTVDFGFGMNGNGNIGGSIAQNSSGSLATGTIAVIPSVGICIGDSMFFDVTVDLIPGASFISDLPGGCLPTDIFFTYTGGTSDAIYSWNFGDGLTSDGPIASLAHTYATDGCFDVTLEVTTTIGCSNSSSISNMICIDPTPIADFIFDPTELSVYDTEVLFTNTSSNSTSYNWYFGDGDSSILTDVNHFFPNDSAGTYVIYLIASSPQGCADTAMQEITLKEQNTFFVPNAFTPDGDGINEQFMPILDGNLNFDKYHFIVFNRWGEIIYESSVPGVGWDGTDLSGSDFIQDGVYIWLLELQYANEVEISQYRGHVTLIR